MAGASIGFTRQDFGSNGIDFVNYIKLLIKIGLSASLALGAVVCFLLLINGETTAEIDLTLDFGALDGIWFLICLPIITILLSLLLSPLSYGIHRLLYGRSRNKRSDDSQFRI